MATEAQQRIREIARRVVGGELDLVAGCRALVDAGSELDDQDWNDPALLVIRGVESETDKYPLGDVRERWDAGALAEQDRRRDAYVASVRGQLLEACGSIIRKFT